MGEAMEGIRDIIDEKELASPSRVRAQHRRGVKPFSRAVLV
ncbi:hypothetical protein R5M74_08025 [Aeromonas hydrophila]|nr:hypothetical protein R5M74_08025 [Aeromonas hydrophila]